MTPVWLYNLMERVWEKSQTGETVSKNTHQRIHKNFQILLKSLDCLCQVIKAVPKIQFRLGAMPIARVQVLVKHSLLLEPKH